MNCARRFEIGEIFLELFFSCVRQEKNRELDCFDREKLGKGLEDWRPVAIFNNISYFIIIIFVTVKFISLKLVKIDKNWIIRYTPVFFEKKNLAQLKYPSNLVSRPTLRTWLYHVDEENLWIARIKGSSDSVWREKEKERKRAFKGDRYYASKHQSITTIVQRKKIPFFSCSRLSRTILNIHSNFIKREGWGWNDFETCCLLLSKRDASITPRRRMDLDRFFCFSIAYKRIRNGQELNFHRRLTRDGRELATPLLFLAFTKDISSGSARFLLSSSTKRNKKKRRRKKGEGEFSILESRQWRLCY